MVEGLLDAARAALGDRLADLELVTEPAKPETLSRDTPRQTAQSELARDTFALFATVEVPDRAEVAMSIEHIYSEDGGVTWITASKHTRAPGPFLDKDGRPMLTPSWGGAVIGQEQPLRRGTLTAVRVVSRKEGHLVNVIKSSFQERAAPP